MTGHARKEKRRRRMIESSVDHFIICGYGRVGRRAAEEFAASGEPFVVLDVNPAAIEIARASGVPLRRGERHGRREPHTRRASTARVA